MGSFSSRRDENKTNHAVCFPESSSKKLYNSIVRIEIFLNEKKISGIGFFIEFNIKNKDRYFLMTCKHIIEEEFVQEKKSIKFHYEKVGNESKLEIVLDKSCIKSFDKPLDVTLIEIF